MAAAQGEGYEAAGLKYRQVAAWEGEVQWFIHSFWFGVGSRAQLGQTCPQGTLEQPSPPP